MVARGVLLVLIIGCATARAEPPVPDLQVRLAVDLPVTIGAAALWVFTEAFKPQIGPARCSWCETRSSLNALDAAGLSLFARASHAAPAVASDVIALGVVPALALGLDLWATLDSVPRRGGRARRFGVDVLLIAEAATTAMAVDQLAKFAIARRRPDAIDQPVAANRTADENLSFFSGHATFAFSLAGAAGTIASLRCDRLAPLIWVLGMGSATTAAMLRVAGDRHFTSDVLVGAVLGSAIGVLVPVLHRTRVPIRLTGAGDHTGGLLAIRGTF